LNRTYVAYGVIGAAGEERQVEQDKNALSVAPGVALERAVAKASAQYRNESWDLVDALKDGKVKLEDLKEEELPEEMQKMDEKEREGYVQAQAKKRSEIQQKISKLNADRKKHVAEKMKELAESGKDTLGAVIVKTVREQAAKKNFKPENTGS